MSPRNVGNFWLEADIDGREHVLQGGPVSKDGGFNLTIYMRNEGCVSRALYVRGVALNDGRIILNVAPVRPTEGSGFSIHTVR